MRERERVREREWVRERERMRERERQRETHTDTQTDTETETETATSTDHIRRHQTVINVIMWVMGESQIRPFFAGVFLIFTDRLWSFYDSTPLRLTIKHSFHGGDFIQNEFMMSVCDYILIYNMSIFLPVENIFHLRYKSLSISAGVWRMHLHSESATCQVTKREAYTWYIIWFYQLYSIMLQD